MVRLSSLKMINSTLHMGLLTHNSQLNNALNKDMCPVLTVVPKHPAIQYNLAIAKLMSLLIFQISSDSLPSNV